MDEVYVCSREDCDAAAYLVDGPSTTAGGDPVRCTRGHHGYSWPVSTISRSTGSMSSTGDDQPATLRLSD